MKSSRSAVEGAFGKLCVYADEALRITGVPGLALAVVKLDEEVTFSKTFCSGSDALGGKIDADTLFQLASVSKPISSTLTALQVSRGELKWDDPVIDIDPRYPLADRAVSVASLLAHRSGLPEHGGDVLEDMGYTRDEILRRFAGLPLTQPLSSERFASWYSYTNFGYTLAAQAAAALHADSWEAAARRDLDTLGLHDTVVTYQALLQRGNRALLHRRMPSPEQGLPPFPANPSWFESARDANAQAPAGGISSSLNDLMTWLTLHIKAQLAPSPGFPDSPFFQALRHTHKPYVTDAKYGLGWNSSETDGVLRLGHSGAFNLGAATAVALVPSSQVGVIALTNGEPLGVPEALCETFLMEMGLVPPRPQPFDFVTLLTVLANLFQDQCHPLPEFVFEPPPASPRPAQPLSNYLGDYLHPYFGPITIAADESALRMNTGPLQNDRSATSALLDHWDGDSFSYVPPGENGGQRSGVSFVIPSAGSAALRSDHLVETYLIGQLDVPKFTDAQVDSWTGIYVLDTRLRAPARGVLRSVNFGAKNGNALQVLVYRPFGTGFTVPSVKALPPPEAGGFNHVFLDGLEVEQGDLIGFYQASAGPVGYGYPTSASSTTRHDLTGPVLFTAKNAADPSAFQFSSERLYLFEIEFVWGLRGPGNAKR